MTDIDNVYLPFLSSLFVVCSSNFWQYMSPMAINVGVSAIQPKKMEKSRSICLFQIARILRLRES